MLIDSLPNEAKLLINISNGDRLAFTAIFNHYQRFVFSFGKKLTHSEEMAIDIVQNVFLKIWEDRERLIKIENFGAYLNRMVRNHCFNSLRSIIGKNNVELNEADIEPEYSTLHQLDYNETLYLINEALNLLSDQQRKVYELCHQQGLKYEEAALQLGISKSTLHTHMKNALRKIRLHLKNNGIIYPLIALILAS